MTRRRIPVIPTRLPDFSLNDLVGQAHLDLRLERQIAGDQLLGHLVRPLPPRNTPAQDPGRRLGWPRLTVVGIAVDYRDKVREFAGQFKIDYPRARSASKTPWMSPPNSAWTRPAFPFTVFTDRRGRGRGLIRRRIASAAGRFHPVGGTKSQSGAHSARRSASAPSPKGLEASWPKRTPDKRIKATFAAEACLFTSNFWLLSRTFVARPRWN